jgi:uncharacterized protein (DUF1800 family)
MAPDPKAQAALALHRFGFGPARDAIAAIAGDPRGALIADLDRPRAGQIVDADLPTSAQAARAVFDFRAEEQARQKVAQRARREAAARRAAMPADNNMMGADGDQASADIAAPENRDAAPPLPRQLFLNEAKARIDAAVGSDIGFAERLVWFWSNHFCISADKIVSMVGPYEREAIRPHVLGRFADMLLAVESHPAMLFYLDNVESLGPNSIAGINRDRGLNENLAREILELHTLGVRSGYTQADVTSLAKVLTGWTWIPMVGNPEHGGQFVFNRRMHEPGAQVVLGKSYPESGVEQGRAVLADLARHPATARHIATKLARHFVADEPPPALVDRLARAFDDTGGDLKAIAVALVTADEAWTAERSKFKPPSEWLTGMVRLTGVPTVPARMVGGQALLGEPLWRPPAPNGFSDMQSAWIDGIAQRLDIVNDFSTRVGDRMDPMQLLDEGLGPLASRETRETIARAESRSQALALLLMAPEFLRR